MRVCEGACVRSRLARASLRRTPLIRVRVAASLRGRQEVLQPACLPAARCPATTPAPTSSPHHHPLFPARSLSTALLQTMKARFEATSFAWRLMGQSCRVLLAGDGGRARRHCARAPASLCGAWCAAHGRPEPTCWPAQLAAGPLLPCCRHGWGNRLMHSMVTACVPVIVQVPACVLPAWLAGLCGAAGMWGHGWRPAQVQAPAGDGLAGRGRASALQSSAVCARLPPSCPRPVLPCTTLTHTCTCTPQEHVFHPFEEVLPYETFSIRLNNADLPRLREILRSVTDDQ